MNFPAQTAPDFGKADLSNCEREQIHLPGSIQPFGALLVLREPDFVVLQASTNAESFLGVDGSLIGRNLDDIPGDLIKQLSPHLGDPLADVPVGLRCRLGTSKAELDGIIHRPSGGGLAVELEPGGPDVDLSRYVQRALSSIVTYASLSQLCDEAAVLFRELTGYDRVMIYRFDEEGHGQVLSECKADTLEPFLGIRYPASDIPKIARRLYERNRVRMLVDVNYEPVGIRPRSSPLSSADLDMSMCHLRSMSPLHIQYLKNMGVCATLVVSLMVGGRLWGLISCHHYKPRLVHYSVRSVCDLLSEAVATRIAALDAFAQGQSETSVRRLEQRMVNSIATKGDWRSALFDGSQTLIGPLDAQGAALLLDGDVDTAGDVPGTQAIRAIGSWLSSRPPAPITTTASIRTDAPDLHQSLPDVGGLLAVPISDVPGDYLMWFRPERIEAVTWGGNPMKPFVVGNSPFDLSPRRSFAQWHELVEGTCEPWSPANRRTGRLIGEIVADVVMQFRSVSLLIAQDQLNKVSRRVQTSVQPVLIADARGQVILTNRSFDTLVQDDDAPLDLVDLCRFFEERDLVVRNISQLTQHRRAWRGEVMFRSGPDERVPFLIRADPVLSAPGQVLGFVILFTDISQQLAAETARRRFQDGLFEPNGTSGLRLTAAAAPRYDALFAPIAENAQVAALEIADGLDMGLVPDTLDSVKSSVKRAAEILGRLLIHANPRAEDSQPPGRQSDR